MHGHLDLVAVADADGRTILRRQSFAAPVHISKPHHDSGWLVVNMASPSPGLLSGDRVNVNVEVEQGAKLLLTAPSACRIHSMEDGFASVTQRYVVRSGGCLDVWPEYLIPQARSEYRQMSHIDVEDGGCLLWTESIAPGRTACGEVFEFRGMRIGTDIHFASMPVLRERYVLFGGHAGIVKLRRHFPEAYYASVVCVAPGTCDSSATLRDIQAGLQSDAVWVGVSRLSSGGVVGKILAADSPSLRSTICRVRTCLKRLAGIESPGLRRITGERSE